MTEKIIIANWKMNKTSKETFEFFRKLKPLLVDISSDKRVIVCPSFLSIPAAARAISGSRIIVGTQNVHFLPKGTFTGEVSIEMLQEFNVQFSIIGHSERREIFGENNQLINKKVKAMLDNKMFPILCVGETLEQREQGLSEKVVGLQLKECFDGIGEDKVTKVLIAYEPIWAISKGDGKSISATPKQAEEMHKFIRNAIIKLYSGQAARKMFILYGGSVNKDNVESLSKMPNINGYLVGGASLDPNHFAQIIRIG